MKAILSLIITSFLITHYASAQDASRKKEFNLDDGIALNGYDPVSYFQGKPLEGKKDISYTFKGVIYHFTTITNQQTFKTSPERYEPAYGGWCAYAMGENGEKVKVDPETFKVVDGRLFLFYNFWGNNTLKSWNKNEKMLKTRADLHWQQLMR